VQRQPSPALERAVWGGLLVIVFVIAGAYYRKATNGLRAPPESLPVIAQVADFHLTNQLGQPVSMADLRGKVWVANIIFSRCPGPCAAMTRQMASLQSALTPGMPVRIVTLTTDPEHDTPAVLKDYAAKAGAREHHWWFVTGGKVPIAALAVDSLKLVSVEKAPAERTSAMDLFIHSTTCVLVDKRGRLRASFETVGEGVDWTRTQQSILAAVRQLLDEK
jgi:protein SCO1/2